MKNLTSRMDPYLFLIMLLSIFLNTAGIRAISMANPYYMAAVVSMKQNFHNFFFASFDPAGFVAVDKPPLAFWIQTVFAIVFGIHGWSVILPQALAGAGSVLILYFLVQPAFGVLSARIAALILAVTPVAVAVSRTNNVDSLLVFFLLLATLFLFRASLQPSRNRRWLFLAYAMIGLAFNIKMLEAFMFLPAFIFLHLISSDEKLRQKISTLAAALVILTAVSLSWSVIVDAVPSQSRPYVGSSITNTETDLAFGYNGAQRLTGQTTGLDLNSEVYSSAASKGFIRLLRVGYGTQISWFLPFAFFGIPFVLIQLRKKSRQNWYRQPAGREVLFWIICLLPAFCVFSFAGFFHRYYFVMIAPSIAALCGIVLPVMYRRFTQLPGLRPFVFPVSLSAVLLLQALYIGYYYRFAGLLFAVIGFILLYRECRPDNRFPFFVPSLRISRIVLWILLAVAPVYWSLTPALYGGNHALPEAGPQLKSQQAGVQLGTRTSSALIHYLNKHQATGTSGTFLFGTLDAPTAAPYIITTGKPVMAAGGFNGTDPILTPARLSQMVLEKKIRYFYIPSPRPVKQTSIEQWVISHGRPVPLNLSAGQLYDLSTGNQAKK